MAHVPLEQVRDEVARPEQVGREVAQAVAHEVRDHQPVDVADRRRDAFDEHVVDEGDRAVHRLDGIREVRRVELLHVEVARAGAVEAAPVAALHGIGAAERERRGDDEPEPPNPPAAHGAGT
jgi:hypothetical protein